MSNSLEKGLADTTLIKNKYARNFVSCGIRELDEMLGGGFMPGTLTLFQQDLGSGCEIIFSKILEPQLSLSNVVLVVLSDPTANFLAEELERLKCENLIILNLVQQSKTNINVVNDKHEISLKIREARRQALELLDQKRLKEKDPNLHLFTIFVSFNPFVLNLSPENVIRILYDNLLECTEHRTIDLILLNKNILSNEMNARIQSLCHSVVDLRSFFEGVQKKNEIRILKMIGRFFDEKIEPYIILYDDRLQTFSFIIKSAFLTSFETFRNLLSWNYGSIALAKEPYIMAPVSYINNLLEMPMNMDRRKGKEEVVEKAQGIGRRMTVMVEKLYFVTDIDLFKATLQTASLLGWGDAILISFEPEENQIILSHKIHSEFNQNVYIAFLEGYYRGVVKRALSRGIRYIKVTHEEEKRDSEDTGMIKTYQIKIRLVRPDEATEEIDQHV
jgi:archaellum biogenesis ATPase FlaH